MGKFLKQIIFFNFLVFLMIFCLEFFFTQRLKEINSEGEIIVWKDLYEGDLKNYSNFIYGSSRAWVHIDPFILEKRTGKKFYNLGADGQNFILQNFRHKELIKVGNIESIIYSVDIFTLNSNKEIFNYYQFLPFMFWQENGIEDFLRPYEYYSKLDFYLPLIRYYGHREIISKIIFEKDEATPLRIRGYQGQEKTWNDDFKRAKKDRESINIKIDQNLLREFEEFLRECNRNNIDLILVYTPEFIEGQNFIENRTEIIKMYQNLSYKYSIPFLDFSKDSLNYNRKYFYNASHLNKTGAELFTKKLADSLKTKSLF